MSLYPHILYWKWDTSIFKKNALEESLKDILSRSDFDLIYVSFHWMDRPFTDSELIECIERCCDYIHKAGKKFMLDIDVRNEGLEFFKKYENKSAWFSYFVECDLDEHGNGSLVLDKVKTLRWGNEKLEAPRYIINAWALHDTADFTFENTSFYWKIALFLVIKKQTLLATSITRAIFLLKKTRAFIQS